MARTLFPRREYAEAMAQQLLQPRALEMGVRSGVFLSNIRRVGKTTFLKQELIPALRERGAVVIYVDLWSDTSKNPSTLVIDAIRSTMKELQVPGSSLTKRLKALNFGAFGVSFGFQIESVGEPGGTLIANALKEVVEKTQTDVVLIIDEVQQSLQPDGMVLMHALKAARDLINADSEAQGHFLLLGTGSHRSQINDMATLPSHPFKGAMTATFELLPREFVQWKLEQAGADGVKGLPSLDAAWAGFQLMGQRPEELEKALRQFQLLHDLNDGSFSIICATLAGAAADSELARASELGGQLGEEVFARIAAGPEEGIKELYSASALKHYSDSTGIEVEVKQVQNVVDKLISANLIARVGHGKFVVSDPFVRQVWRERQAFDDAFKEASAAVEQRATGHHKAVSTRSSKS